jgi:four helix bundle protein
MEQKTQSDYKNLQVWQKGMAFANAVIDLTEKVQTPGKHYRLMEQLESAATSVPMNIAEGKGRHSDKEFIRFLYIARGSLYERMTLLSIFEMRSGITHQSLEALKIQSDQIAKMIHRLISSLDWPSPWPMAFSQ